MRLDGRPFSPTSLRRSDTSIQVLGGDLRAVLQPSSLEMRRNAGSSTGTPSFSFWTTWRPCNCIVCALVIKSCVVLLDHVNMQTGITLVLTMNEATSSVSVQGGRRFQSFSCRRIHGRKDCNSMAKRERNC